MSYRPGWGDMLGYAIIWGMVALAVGLVVYDISMAIHYWNAA